MIILVSPNGDVANYINGVLSLSDGDLVMKVPGLPTVIIATDDHAVRCMRYYTTILKRGDRFVDLRMVK